MAMGTASTITPSKKPICSICIANYNGIGIIDSAIESVSAQDCDFEFEIIIRLFQAHLNGLVSGQRFKIKLILNLDLNASVSPPRNSIQPNIFALIEPYAQILAGCF
jgi:hypothetical protein